VKFVNSSNLVCQKKGGGIEPTQGLLASEACHSNHIVVFDVSW
jgi:hypothetical protein